MKDTSGKEPIEILEECIDLQKLKGADYQSEASSVRQADYYPRGVWTLYDIIHAKMLRIKSVLEKIDGGDEANFESLSDSCKDAINYLSFMASYLDYGIDGQSEDKDIFNNTL